MVLCGAIIRSKSDIALPSFILRNAYKLSSGMLTSQTEMVNMLNIIPTSLYPHRAASVPSFVFRSISISEVIYNVKSALP